MSVVIQCAIFSCNIHYRKCNKYEINTYFLKISLKKERLSLYKISLFYLISYMILNARKFPHK